MGVDPSDFLRSIDRLDGRFHHNRIPVISYQDAYEFLFRASIQLLMRHIRRDVDEITRPRVGEVLKTLSPSQSRPSANNVDHAFQIPVLMSSRPGIRWNRYRTRPNLARTGRGIGYGRPEIHARPRWHVVVIQLIMPHDTDVVVTPIRYSRRHRISPQATPIIQCKLIRLTGNKSLPIGFRNDSAGFPSDNQREDLLGCSLGEKNPDISSKNAELDLMARHTERNWAPLGGNIRSIISPCRRRIRL